MTYLTIWHTVSVKWATRIGRHSARTGANNAQKPPHANANRSKEKKSLTPGWVVYGKRRHAEPPEEDVPPQLYPW
jgi:hypothetical protein